MTMSPNMPAAIPLTEVPDCRMQSITLANAQRPAPQQFRLFSHSAFQLQAIESRAKNSTATTDWTLYTVPELRFLIAPGRDGIALSADNIPIAESLRFLRNPDAILREFVGPVVDLPEPVLLGFNPGWYNYFHWLVLTLTTLHLAQSVLDDCPQLILPEYPDRNPDQFAESPTSANAILPAFSKQVYKQSLAAYELNSVHQLPPGIYRAPQASFLIPDTEKDFDGVVSNPISTLLNSLSNTVRSGKRQTDSARVFLSRRHRHNDRRLDRHEEALFQCLQVHGFTRVYMDQFDYATQQQIMHDADIVAGIHGAALTNVLFMREGAQLIEFSDLIGEQTTLRPHFSVLARLRNINYNIIKIDDEMQADYLANCLQSALAA